MVIDWYGLKAAFAGVTDDTTSFERCNRIAERRKRTHYQREARVVEAHAVQGLLPGWNELFEPVHAVNRMRADWWREAALWDTGINHRSAVEYEAMKSIRWQAGARTKKEVLQRVVYEAMVEVMADALDSHGCLTLREIKHGISHAEARALLDVA